MSNAYVIMCNDAPRAVVIGTEDEADAEVTHRRQAHWFEHAALHGIAETADTYADTHHWRTNLVPLVRPVSGSDAALVVHLAAILQCCADDDPDRPRQLAAAIKEAIV